MALWWAFAGATARFRGYVSASGAARRCRADRLPRVPQGPFCIWSVCIAPMWALRARAGHTLHLYKARGILLVRPLFAFRNCPIATPHRASEVHSLSGPNFKGIPPSNILRTRGSGRINSIQIRRSSRLRTWATMTKKWIAALARFSAHSAGKHSKDLHAHPDQIHSDRGAAHREGVKNGCLQFRYPNWFSASRRGVRSEIFSARMWPPWYASASSAARVRRHDRRPQTRQAHKRYVHVHPPMLGSFSRSGSYLIMWPQCLAPASSAARGRRFC